MQINNKWDKKNLNISRRLSFCGAKTSVYKQIGNAVPVRLALAVAEPIAEFAKNNLLQEEETLIEVCV